MEPEGVSGTGSINDRKYDIFRKRFHIPRKWMESTPLVNLIRFNYTTDDLSQAMSDIENLHEKTVYPTMDNLQMLHDYLHFLLIDVLTHRGIPFVEECEMSSEPFKSLLKCTPDLLISGRILLEVYIGGEVSVIEQKKTKYATLSLAFNKRFIMTQGSISDVCVAIGLTEDDAKYVQANFNIFKCEYTYWTSCRKLGKILRNEADNIPMRTLDVPPDFDTKKYTYREKLLARLQSVAEGD